MMQQQSYQTGQAKGRDSTFALSNCNIGSAATTFGNPQNTFIASSAGVSLLEALIILLPSAAVGLLLNIAVLYGFYMINVWWHKYCACNRTELIKQRTNRN